MAPRRRALRIISDSSSEGSENGVAFTENEPASAAATAEEEEDDIEVLDSPTCRSSCNGAVADAFAANPTSDPPIICSTRILSSPSAPPSSSSFSFGPNGNSARSDIPVTINYHSRSDAPTASLGNALSSRYSALEGILQSRGVRANPHWLDTCIENLVSSRAGFCQLSASQQAEICFTHILHADFNVMGAGILPPQLHNLHRTELAGPFVLQVDEVTDISVPIRQRYKERGANENRCLKLSMSDGVQRVYGIEYRSIRNLNSMLPAGFKVAIHHVNIRRGLFLLVPETVIVLGGQVDRLEAARQRVVQHVNKPPRGTRGTVGQSLIESASSAAWNVALTRESAPISGGAMGPIHEGPISDPSVAVVNLNMKDVPVRDEIGSSATGAVSNSVTYLSLLQERWALCQRGGSNLQGRIKCVLTGVKEFHFKDREHFRLVVYVDDGSQIANLIIHHQVVQQCVGFSAREVSAALVSSCPDEVLNMKKNLGLFQAFLTKFEGILLVQKNDEDEMPVVTEMTEGCSNHDAWLLMERLLGRNENSPLTEPRVVELSP